MNDIIPAMQRRYDRAQAALDAWDTAGGHNDECAVEDLLVDLLHVLERDGLDPQGSIETALMHWQAERGEGDDIEQDHRASFDPSTVAHSRA